MGRVCEVSRPGDPVTWNTCRVPLWQPGLKAVTFLLSALESVFWVGLPKVGGRGDPNDQIAGLISIDTAARSRQDPGAVRWAAGFPSGLERFFAPMTWGSDEGWGD